MSLALLVHSFIYFLPLILTPLFSNFMRLFSSLVFFIVIYTGICTYVLELMINKEE